MKEFTPGEIGQEVFVFETPYIFKSKIVDMRSDMRNAVYVQRNISDEKSKKLYFEKNLYRTEEELVEEVENAIDYLEDAKKELEISIERKNEAFKGLYGNEEGSNS